MNKTTKPRGRVELQERDLDILEKISLLRFVTLEHIFKLYPSSEEKIINPKAEFRQGHKALDMRLKKLAQHGFLIRIGYPHLSVQEPSIFALDEKGANALSRERGFDFEELVPQITYLHKYLETPSYKRPHFNHRLGLNQFRLTLALALRQHPNADWLYEQGAPYWSEPQPVRDKNNKILEYPIEATVKGKTLGKTPDSIFILKPAEEQKHSIGYIYEKDRGTEVHSTVFWKLFCYYHWHKQGQHRDYFKTGHLRVLIETENERRLKKMILRSALKFNQGSGSGIFWFTTTNNISLENPQKILEKIWIIGHRDYYNPAQPIREQQKHSLLEFLTPKAQKQPQEAEAAPGWEIYQDYS